MRSCGLSPMVNPIDVEQFMNAVARIPALVGASIADSRHRLGSWSRCEREVEAEGEDRSNEEK